MMSTSTHRFVRVLCLCGLIGPQVSASAGGLDEALVRKLLDTKSLKALESATPKEALQDPALLALYRARRLALNKTAEEGHAFLGALPKTEKELNRVFVLTHLELYRTSPYDVALADVTYGMFERAARLAHTLKTGHEQVFKLCLWSDGEVAEMAWEWCDWLHVQDPARSFAAIRALPVEEQKRICGVPIETLTVKEAVSECRSETSGPLE